mmetsp:Transcript_4818/g.6281  ORF Transcript_4818/g.6281 Transcript_4818/m.6281 type:complete len:158 (+) Transcript_4818:153-626(+)
MKVSSVLLVAMCMKSTSAFCPQSSSRKSHVSLFAENSVESSRRDILGKLSVAAAGWALTSQTALADVEKLDFSLPSYDSQIKSKSVGFGDGTEAFLSGDTSKYEKQRQQEAMQKAEEARKVRLEQKKELDKLRDEETRARNREKAAEKARRMKGIFD